MTDDRFYSHAYRRPLTAEVLADAIADVTGVVNLYGDSPIGTRAVTLVDPLAPAPSLDILGRCTRRDGCDTTGTAAGGLPAQLHLLNGQMINAKLTDKNGRLQRRIDRRMSDGEIVTEFILRAFGRRPSDDELKAWCDRLATTDSQERRERLEDFVWSLLNSRQFREND
jgi:hypothetical protein